MKIKLALEWFVNPDHLPFIVGLDKGLYKKNNIERKVGAIGIRIKKWVAYHGFSINISNDISNYQKIVPCGIKNKGIISLKEINNQNYNSLSDVIINNFISNLKI